MGFDEEMCIEMRGLVGYEEDESIKHEIEKLFCRDPLFNFQQEELDIDFNTPERGKEIH